jgi:long-chain fatty acid transport protein
MVLFAKRRHPVRQIPLNQNTDSVGWLLWIMALAPSPLLGLGLRIPDQDPAAVARGNAFVATADNPSALYYNPAGIAQLDGLRFRSGVYAIALESVYRSGGSRVDTKDEVHPVPQLYYTYGPSDLPVAFGLGVFSPYGLGLEWPENSGFRTLAIEGRITYVSLNPVAAWKIHPNLSIAAGPTFNYADTELRRGVFAPGDEFKFKGDDIALGFNAGILWQPHPKHSFGVSYRSGTTMDFDGHSRLHFRSPGPPFFPVPAGVAISRSDSATAKFKFPQFVIAGWSFRPTPEWNLEFNVDWADWDRLNTVTLKQKNSGNVPLTFNWTSSFLYEWGATRYFTRGWRASAGYIYSENSVPDASFNPLLPDSDRHIFSVGVGRTYKHANWDFAYQFAYGPSRSVSGSPRSPVGESADGQYRFYSHALSFSIGYNF